MSDRSGSDGDVIGVRNFREGDSLRHINWAKTASQGRLIVQERQTCAQRPIQVFVDLTAENHRGANGQSSYEWAIRIAASVCQQLHHHRSQVTLACLGLPSGCPSQSSNQKGIDSLLDFLAMLPDFVTGESRAASDTSMVGGTQFYNDQSKTICIKTSLSNLDVPTKDSHLIVLDIEKFGLEPAERKRQTVTQGDSQQESQPQGSPILITQPGKASDELQFGWQRSCEHVA